MTSTRRSIGAVRRPHLLVLCLLWTLTVASANTLPSAHDGSTADEPESEHFERRQMFGLPWGVFNHIAEGPTVPAPMGPQLPGQPVSNPADPAGLPLPDGMQMGPDPLPMDPQPALPPGPAIPGMETVPPLGPPQIPGMDTPPTPGPAQLPGMGTALPGPAPVPNIETALPPGPPQIPDMETALPPGAPQVPDMGTVLPPGPASIPGVETTLPSGPEPPPVTAQLPQTAQLPGEPLSSNLPTGAEGLPPALPSATMDGTGLPLPTVGSVIPELPPISLANIAQSLTEQFPPAPTDFPQAPSLTSAILGTVCSVVEGQGDAITTRVIPCPQASVGSLPAPGGAPVPTSLPDNGQSLLTLWPTGSALLPSQVLSQGGDLPSDTVFPGATSLLSQLPATVPGPAEQLPTAVPLSTPTLDQGLPLPSVNLPGTIPGTVAEITLWPTGTAQQTGTAPGGLPAPPAPPSPEPTAGPSQVSQGPQPSPPGSQPGPAQPGQPPNTQGGQQPDPQAPTAPPPTQPNTGPSAPPTSQPNPQAPGSQPGQTQGVPQPAPDAAQPGNSNPSQANGQTVPNAGQPGTPTSPQDDASPDSPQAPGSGPPGEAQTTRAATQAIPRQAPADEPGFGNVPSPGGASNACPPCPANNCPGLPPSTPTPDPRQGPCPGRGYSCAECLNGWFCPPQETPMQKAPCGFGWPCYHCPGGWYCAPGPTPTSSACPPSESQGNGPATVTVTAPPACSGSNCPPGSTPGSNNGPCPGPNCPTSPSPGGPSPGGGCTGPGCPPGPSPGGPGCVGPNCPPDGNGTGACTGANCPPRPTSRGPGGNGNGVCPGPNCLPSPTPGGPGCVGPDCPPDGNGACPGPNRPPSTSGGPGCVGPNCPPGGNGNRGCTGANCPPTTDPGGPGCTGPNCPPPTTPGGGPGCTGPNCPPTPGGPGCTGPNCPPGSGPGGPPTYGGSKPGDGGNGVQVRAAPEVRGWKYLGCFSDSARRTLDCDPDDVLYAGNMSNDKCVEHCGKKGYKLAGTEWSRECWCGNVFRNARRLPEVQCDSPCDGNSKDVCGGDWALTVYSQDGTGVNTISPDDGNNDGSTIIKAGGKRARDAAGADREIDGNGNSDSGGAATNPTPTSFATYPSRRAASPTTVSQAPTFLTAGVGALPTGGTASDDVGGNILSAIESIVKAIPSDLGFGDVWADEPVESGHPRVETRDESGHRNDADQTKHHIARKRRDVGQRASWNETDAPLRWYKTWQG